LREFIELLNSHDARYLIVGGHAVAYHGYPRMTGDIDFFVEVSEENAHKLIAVLGQFGFASLGETSSCQSRRLLAVQCGGMGIQSGGFPGNFTLRRIASSLAPGGFRWM
jgi:hypothetical protein